MYEWQCPGPWILGGTAVLDVGFWGCSDECLMGLLLRLLGDLHVDDELAQDGTPMHLHVEQIGSGLTNPLPESAALRIGD